MVEVFIPAVVLALRILGIPVLVTLSGHIVVSVVTGDRHQGMEIEFAACDTVLIHTGLHILLVVVGHVDSSDEKVGVISLQGLLELGVTDVGLEGVVGVGITVTHESDGSFLCLRGVEGVELLGHLGDVLVGVAEQRHT